jgi:succinate dehydrogenase/fumarate reductase flavoprotein subunit
MEDMYDVIVVGGGNAAMCAALSANEHGARVLVLERAPEEKRGGNSASLVAASAWFITAPRISRRSCLI